MLLLLPTQRDSELTADVLEKNGIAATICETPLELSQQLEIGAAAVLAAEEALFHGGQSSLALAIGVQPRWSDLPVLVLTRSGADSLEAGEAVAQLGNVTLLERPLRLASLISTVRSALRARERQYQIRTHLDSLEKAREEQAAAARRKDEFLAMLGHELRNPLAPIRNALHLVGTGQDTTRNENLRAMMQRQVDHMVRLVDDLVEVSRLSRGTIELRREPIALGTVLKSAIDLSRPLIDAGRHELSLELADDGLALDADPVRIAQVFGNLLNNAAKYSAPDGHITLSMRREGSEAVVSVLDRGIGIEPEMLPDVFELFTQGRRLAHRAQDGLGIGLTVVRSLVDMHGGTVSATSPGPGQGSEFVVRLPLAAGISLANDSVPSKDPPSADNARIHASKLRVLVVDDNVDAAKSMGMVLDLMGINHRVEFSGAGALQAAKQFRPHAVLLDIGMPHMDGYEVARRLLQDPSNARMTLIALTGWSQANDQQKTSAAGFAHHLSKPADLDALRALLEKLEPLAVAESDGDAVHPGTDTNSLRSVAN